MKKSWKALLFFLGILLICSLIFNYYSIKTIKEKEDYYSTYYIHDFYHEMKTAIKQLDWIIEENDNTDDLHRDFFSLIETLSKLDYMYGRVPYYFDGMGLGLTYIGDTILTIKQGTTYKGHSIHPFLEDHKLDQKETAYLKLLRNYFETIVQSLSDENGLLSEKISKRKFEDILDNNMTIFIVKDELLEEYITN